MKKKMLLVVGIFALIAGLTVAGVLYMRHKHRASQDYSIAALSVLTDDEVKIALKDKTLRSYESWSKATLNKGVFVNSAEARYVSRAFEQLGSYDKSLQTYQVLEQLLPANEKNASFYVNYAGLAAVAQKPDIIADAHAKANDYLKTLPESEREYESLIIERGFARVEGE